jgi:hypothetical protein
VESVEARCGGKNDQKVRENEDWKRSIIALEFFIA